jgi:hypothetical protein
MTPGPLAIESISAISLATHDMARFHAGLGLLMACAIVNVLTNLLVPGAVKTRTRTQRPPDSARTRNNPWLP